MQTEPAQVTVNRAGHPIHSIYVLVSGNTQTSAADSQGRRVSIKLHRCGEVHGLFLWATQHLEAHLDVVTLVPSTLLVIPIKVLEEVLASEPQLWQSIAAEASRRLIITMEIAMSFGLESARIRFARHILEQAESAETGLEMKTPQVVRMSQQVMAELLGVSRQTVTSLVREFEEQGHIHWRYGRIEVLDLEGLRSAAKFVWQREARPLSAA
jgi:CRP-like cAMP-binding protein